MAVTFSGSTSGSYNSTAKNQHIIWIDQIGTLTNGLLIVSVDTRTTTTASAISFGGISASSAGSRVNGGGAPNQSSQISYLVNPASSGSLVVGFPSNITTFSVYVAWAVGALQNQETVLNAVVTGSGTSSTPNVNITTGSAGCIIFATIQSESNNVPSSSAVVYDTDDFGAFVSAASYFEQSGSGLKSMEYSTLNDEYALVAAAFSPAPTINESPTVELITGSGTIFTSPTPTLYFSGSDVENNSIRYQIQITDNPLGFESGSLLRDNYPHSGAGGLIVHTQPEIPNISAWTGELQLDDRPGQSFKGGGGILKEIKIYCGSDAASTSTSGISFLRIYTHSGSYGLTGSPLNAAESENTPTSGCLAVSSNLTFTTSSSPGWYSFPFVNENQIRMSYETPYFWIAEWYPRGSGSQSPENALAVWGDWSQGGNPPTHAGNMYIDGALIDHTGYWTTITSGSGDFRDADLYFQTYEDFILQSKISGSDSGFENVYDGSDTDPFDSGSLISYTVQAGSPLSNGMYYWRIRGIDPDGSNIYGSWSGSRTFSITSGSASIQGSTVLTGNISQFINSLLSIQSLINVVSNSELSSAAINVILNYANISGLSSLISSGIIQAIVSSNVSIDGKLDLIATSLNIINGSIILDANSQISLQSLIYALCNIILYGQADKEISAKLLIQSLLLLSGNGDLINQGINNIISNAPLYGNVLNTFNTISNIPSNVSLYSNANLELFSKLLITNTIDISGLSVLIASYLVESTVIGSASLLGQGNLIFAPLYNILSQAILSGNNEIILNAKVLINSIISLLGLGDLSLDGKNIEISFADIFGNSELFSLGKSIAIALSQLSGQGNIDSFSKLIISDSVSLGGVGLLLATALFEGIVRGEITISSSGDLIFNSKNIIPASIILENEILLSAFSTIILKSLVQMTGNEDLNFYSILSIPSSVNLGALAFLIASGLIVGPVVTVEGQAILSGNADLITTALNVVAGNFVGTGNALLSLQSLINVLTNAILNGQGNIDANSILLVSAMTTLIASGLISPIGDISIPITGVVVPTPLERTYIVIGDDRIYLIDKSGRVFSINSDFRIFNVD